MQNWESLGKIEMDTGGLDSLLERMMANLSVDGNGFLVIDDIQEGEKK